MHLFVVYSSTSASDKQEGGGEKEEAVKLFWKDAQRNGGTHIAKALCCARGRSVCYSPWCDLATLEWLHQGFGDKPALGCRCTGSKRIQKQTGNRTQEGRHFKRKEMELMAFRQCFRFREGKISPIWKMVILPDNLIYLACYNIENLHWGAVFCADNVRKLLL